MDMEECQTILPQIRQRLDGGFPEKNKRHGENMNKLPNFHSNYSDPWL